MNAPRATLIGTFILGALALLVAGVLFFGGNALRNEHVKIVSFFDASVSGLRVGAPVTFRGVPIGEVKSIGVRVNPRTGQSIIQVNMELVPHALSVYGAPLPRDEAFVPSLVHDGLTAQLMMQSFVTGLLSVELAFRPGEQVLRFGDATLPEVPSVPGHFEALAKQLETIDIAAVLDSLQRTLAAAQPALHQLPRVLTSLERTLGTIDREVGASSASLQQTLDTVRTLATNEVGASSASLQQTLGAARTLATNLDREGASTLAAMRQTLAKADATLDGAHALVDPHGHTAMQVQRAVDDLAATSARLRNLAERVDRDPSVLVRGR
ncbi:MAG TPA: MlaD family protein [Casimicrobiaceae bacterium]|nr:MlaD family protein [Casimicrobiaceae bacterium]